eukprot:13783754-Alexandrium_andersonii.AAC.1
MPGAGQADGGPSPTLPARATSLAEVGGEAPPAGGPPHSGADLPACPPPGRIDLSGDHLHGGIGQPQPAGPPVSLAPPERHGP